MKIIKKRIITMLLALIMMMTSVCLPEQTAKAEDAVSVSISSCSGTVLTLSNDTIAAAGVTAETVFSAVSDTDGIFYNDTKQDATLTYSTDGKLSFTLGDDVTPAVGDIVKVTGSFSSDSITISVTEYSMLYSGSKWLTYIATTYNWINTSASNATNLYIKMNHTIGTSYYVNYAPLTDEDGIYRNGVKVDSAKLQLQSGCQTFHYGLNPTANTGDLITWTGKFIYGDYCVDITSVTVCWTGAKWIVSTGVSGYHSYFDANSSSSTKIRAQIGTQVKSSGTYTSYQSGQGVLYNGEWISGATVTFESGLKYYGYSFATATKGDTIAVCGQFVKMGSSSANYVKITNRTSATSQYYYFYYNGNKWVQGQSVQSISGGKGDLVYDSEVNIADLVRLKKYVDNGAGQYFKLNANVNDDTAVDGNDVTALRNNILSGLAAGDSGI